MLTTITILYWNKIKICRPDKILNSASDEPAGFGSSKVLVYCGGKVGGLWWREGGGCIRAMMKVTPDFCFPNFGRCDMVMVCTCMYFLSIFCISTYIVSQKFFGVKCAVFCIKLWKPWPPHSPETHVQTLLTTVSTKVTRVRTAKENRDWRR